jgi:hypothetical protein
MRLSSVLLFHVAVLHIVSSSVSGFCPRVSFDTRATISCKTQTSLKAAKEQNETHVPDDTSRRSVVMFPATSLLASGLIAWSSPQPVSASDVRGPIELLRPPTRVKLYIDNAIDLCQSSAKTTTGDSNKLASLQKLGDFFAHEPTTFMTAEETKLSRRYLEIDTSSAWQAARRKEREEKGKAYGVDYTTPYDQLNTALQQFGDKQTFQILRSRQRKLERNSAMRAAFNAYTNNLVFGDSYQLNMQGDEKKAMVRNDALPDVNAVVVSDLDLRDLFRNQVLQNMDDAKAELEYQVSSQQIDFNEILTCLLAARACCDEWFSFIPKEDVEAALEAVLQEKRYQ